MTFRFYKIQLWHIPAWCLWHVTLDAKWYLTRPLFWCLNVHHITAHLIELFIGSV